MKITLNIKSCRECPHCTNSAILHDDAFTGAADPLRWYCKYGRYNLRDISNEDIIDKDCPLNKK
jgi:hypothetical protein